VLEDDDVRSERLLLGRRTAQAPTTVVVVKDSDDDYTIRWQQCGNIFAPKRLIAGKAPKGTSGYDCGVAKTYKEHELNVREGDPSTRRVHYLPPPEPACWTGTDAPAPTGQASASPEAAAPAATAQPQSGASAAASSEKTAPPIASSSASVMNPPPFPSTQP
jgi:hypothetical protein